MRFFYRRVFVVPRLVEKYKSLQLFILPGFISNENRTAVLP
uniref:Uncharacterized protein n=1 Tax=Aegilops tauschii subsp. strangulata TaxID=200361 RepID=A0A453RXW3_AEGTS